MSNRQVVKKQIKRVELRGGNVKFLKLYTKTNFYFRWACAGLLGVIMSFIVLLVVESTGLYTGGVTALFQGVARLANVIMYEAGVDATTTSIVYNVLFWGLYLTFNFPLLIFAYKKLSKEFAIITGTYLFCMQVLGFIWAAFVPAFHGLMLFGTTATVDQNLLSAGVQNIIFSPNVFPTLDMNTDQWIWSTFNTDKTLIHESVYLSIQSANIDRFLMLMLYSITFACSTGIVWSLLYILGGCSAGTDITSIYYSQEKNKSLGSMIIIICVISMVIGIFLGSYVSGIMVNPEVYSGWQYFFSGTLVASLTWVILNGIIIDKIFPWHKLVRVEIITNKYDEIRKCLIMGKKLINPTTSFNGKGGYSEEKTNMFLTVCMVMELIPLIEKVREIDDKALIITTNIDDIDGSVNVKKQVS